MNATGPSYCFLVTTPTATEFTKKIHRVKKNGKQCSRRGRGLCIAPPKRRVRRIRPRCCVERPWITKVTDADIVSNDKLIELERELDKAMYEDDEARVSEIRDEISHLQTASYVDVLSANMKFYKAFSGGSLVDMGACWLKDNNVTCKHPLGPLFTGFWKVIDSFAGMFSIGIPDVSATNIRISLRGSVAIVTCEERANIIARRRG